MRDQIVRQLADTYKQKRVAIGLTTSGEVLEIFVAPGGIWTAVVSRADGWGCVVASGEAWTAVPLPVGPEA